MTVPLIWGMLATMGAQVAITWCVGRIGVANMELHRLSDSHQPPGRERTRRLVGSVHIDNQKIAALEAFRRAGLEKCECALVLSLIASCLAQHSV